jgi:hypothetical protein
LTFFDLFCLFGPGTTSFSPNKVPTFKPSAITTLIPEHAIATCETQRPPLTNRLTLRSWFNLSIDFQTTSPSYIYRLPPVRVSSLPIPSTLIFVDFASDVIILSSLLNISDIDRSTTLQKQIDRIGRQASPFVSDVPRIGGDRKDQYDSSTSSVQPDVSPRRQP